MRVVARKRHFGLEVAAVVERVFVEHDERDAPLEDVIVDHLRGGLAGCFARHWEAGMCCSESRTSMFVHFSLLSCLNSFMSTRCAASPMMPSLSGVLTQASALRGSGLRVYVAAWRSGAVRWCVVVSVSCRREWGGEKERECVCVCVRGLQQKK
jgi:hypothetical protein